MEIGKELKQMFENSWQGKLWSKIETWINNQSSCKASYLATSDYGKVEEFIQSLLDERDAEIKLLKREVYLLKDEVEFLSKDFTMGS